MANPTRFAAPLPLRALVKRVAVPDPGATEDGGRYFMVGTTNDTKDTFHVFTAPSPDGPWTRAKDAKGRPISVFPAGQTPKWIHRDSPDRWAPELHNIDGQRACIYTGRALDDLLKVAISLTDSYTGKYIDLGPILAAEHGVIDATYWFDRKSGKHVMVYKLDDNSVGEATPILTRTFTLEHGVFEWTSEPHQIAISGDGHGGLLEAPFLCWANGTTWIVLSSDYFGDERYKMWIGRIDDVTTGKVEDLRPLMTSDSPCLEGQWKGPGHCSLIEQAPGVFAMFYHAWPAENPTAAPFEERFTRNKESRKPLRSTLAFVDSDGKPCEPYIVEDKLVASPQQRA